LEGLFDIATARNSHRSPLTPHHQKTLIGKNTIPITLLLNQVLSACFPPRGSSFYGLYYYYYYYYFHHPNLELESVIKGIQPEELKEVDEQRKMLTLSIIHAQETPLTDE